MPDVPDCQRLSGNLGTEGNFRDRHRTTVAGNSVPVPEIPPKLPTLGLQAAYVVFIYLFGFFAATLAFLSIAPVQMRYTRWGVVLTNAVVLTLALTGSFLWLFSVQLPAGIIWDLW